MDNYKQKLIANNMEPIFKKMKIGDRGIFDKDGQEFFVAKHLPKLSVGAYRDRKYILPIKYLNDVKTGLELEAGFQITAGYFGSHFNYIPSANSIQKGNVEKSSLADQIQSASSRAAEAHPSGKTPIKEVAPER